MPIIDVRVVLHRNWRRLPVGFREALSGSADLLVSENKEWLKKIAMVNKAGCK
jgi:hypothetical protein